MLILVSNDDSYRANGLYALIDELLQYGEVVAVCPDEPRSGQSMAITVSDALRITRLPDYKGAKVYKTNGTPVDCVKLAMHTILDRRPDIVVAGVNHGSNAAINVLYSGTMGAAMEGCAFGIPSVGFSLTSHDPEADFSPCVPVIRKIMDFVIGKGLPEGICLNVNIPDKSGIPKEIRFVRSCEGNWSDEYKEYVDPQGKKFYLLTGKFENLEPESTDTDEWCLAHGIASAVPIQLDRTADTGSLRGFSISLTEPE